ncbi:MAG: hypothetical protein ACK4E0_01255 [Chitinophagaceae bacterium]
MHRFVATILLFSFLGQSFSQGWYYLGYLVQKEEYMKRCVNKALPQLRCNGKCQLMQKIKAQEEKEQGQPPEMKLAAKLDVLSSKSFFTVPLPVQTAASPNWSAPRAMGMPIDQASSIFHPPNPA